MSENLGFEDRQSRIEIELAATRAELSSSVDALVGQLTPQYQWERAKEAAGEKARQWRAHAEETVAEAREGDPRALRAVGIAAAGAVAVTALLVWRLTRRH